MTSTDEAIQSERAAVYGDPLENHHGIALAWAPLLHAHREAVARMEPLPEWVISLMMASLKLLRMRYVYHEDNFPDARNYLKFTEEWQRASRGGSCLADSSSVSPGNPVCEATGDHRQ